MTSRLVCSSVPAAVKMVAESVVRFTTKRPPCTSGFISRSRGISRPSSAVPMVVTTTLDMELVL